MLMVIEEKRMWCPIRATMLLPDDVGSPLTDVDWFGAGEPEHEVRARQERIQIRREMIVKRQRRAA